MTGTAIVRAKLNQPTTTSRRRVAGASGAASRGARAAAAGQARNRARASRRRAGRPGRTWPSASDRSPSRARPSGTRKSPTTPTATSSSVHGTCQDVTEARRVEDALRAAEQLFRRAFDDSPIGMALIDLEGRWLRLNRALAQMLGRTEAELRATTLGALSHPEDAELDRPLIRELLAGRRRSYAIEKRMMHADGRVLHAARARLADARRRRAPAVLPRPARSTSASAAAPRPSAAPASSACRRSSTTRRR